MALVLNPDADMLKPFVVRFLLTSALAAATLCARAVEQTDDKLRPLLACFFATRMPEKDMEARIQSVIDRVRPTVPSLSSLMQPKPEAPLVFKVEKPEQSLIF